LFSENTDMLLLLLFVLFWRRADSVSCRIGSIRFLGGWHKRRPEPRFSFIRFSFVYVCSFISCCL